jgi:hypothetical protein
LELSVSYLGGFAMVDDSIKIQRLPYPVVGINKIKELEKRREGKEEDEFNEYIKDTMKKEKEEQKSSLNSDEKENLKKVGEGTSTDSDDGTKIDIIV